MSSTPIEARLRQGPAEQGAIEHAPWNKHKRTCNTTASSGSVTRPSVEYIHCITYKICIATTS